MTFDNIAIMIATNDRGMSAILDRIDPGADPGFWKRPALVPAVPVPSGPIPEGLNDDQLEAVYTAIDEAKETLRGAGLTGSFTINLDILGFEDDE